MDTERLRQALIASRKNLRVALKAIGSNREVGKLIPPPDGADILEGVDVTPSEMIVYLDHMLHLERSRSASLEHMAMIGAAVEMGMHEVNSEMNYARGSIQGAQKKLGEASPKELENALAAIQHLNSSLSIFHAMSPASGGYYVTGQHIAETLDAIYARYLKSDRITLEITPALRSARINASTNLVMPALLNLVRNALYWTSRSDRPRLVRLDATTHTREVPSWDEKEPPTTQEEIIVSVSDSGPGVSPQDHGTIFLPFKSGRGSAGIGLYLTQKKLNDTHMAVVLDPEPSDLGGAVFKFGSRAVLEPAPMEPLSRREELALAATGIAEMLQDDHADDVLRLHAGTYGEICVEALRIRLEGPSDEADHAILASHGAIEEAVAQRRSAPRMG